MQLYRTAFVNVSQDTGHVTRSRLCRLPEEGIGIQAESCWTFVWKNISVTTLDDVINGENHWQKIQALKTYSITMGKERVYPSLSQASDRWVTPVVANSMFPTEKSDPSSEQLDDAHPNVTQFLPLV